MTEIDITRTDAHRPVVERTGFRLSWGAILAGAVVATALQMVFSVLGLAIGLGAYDVGDAARPFGIGAAVWVLLTALVTLFVGGMTTGRLAGVLTRGDGMLHGIVLWGVSALLAAWMVASGAGALLGGAFNVVGRTAAAATGGVVGAAGQVIGGAVGQAGNVDLGALQQEVERTLEQSGVPALQPDSLQAAAAAARDDATGPGASNQQLASEIAGDIQRRAGQVDREAIVNVLAARTDMDRAEAERVATRVEGAATSLRTQVAAGLDTVAERAGDVTDQATDALSTAAWWALLALALSAGAAAFGAATTARD